MKITGETTCPNCKKDHEASFDIDKLEVKTPIVTHPSTTTDIVGTTVQQLMVEPEKPKPVLKIPSDEPFYTCKDCDGMHKNPNYKLRPNKKCSNCGSLNGSKNKGCKNCDNKEFDELDEEELDELNIPKPLEDNHEHE